jgi:N-acetylmuramoyl-L-alanine amidase
MESEIKLSRKASDRFVKVVETRTTDAQGQTYVQRMRERAEVARRKHAAV